MNDEESGLLQSSSAESSAADQFFNQARKIEHDMHNVMKRQVKLALVQIALGILSILAAFILASLG